MIFTQDLISLKHEKEEYTNKETYSSLRKIKNHTIFQSNISRIFLYISYFIETFSHHLI